MVILISLPSIVSVTSLTMPFQSTLPPSVSVMILMGTIVLSFLSSGAASFAIVFSSTVTFLLPIRILITIFSCGLSFPASSSLSEGLVTAVPFPSAGASAFSVSAEEPPEDECRFLIVSVPFSQMTS